MRPPPQLIGRIGRPRMGHWGGEVGINPAYFDQVTRRSEFRFGGTANAIHLFISISVSRVGEFRKSPHFKESITQRESGRGPIYDTF